MNYVAACLVILSSLVIVSLAKARWINVPEKTNDGATLSFDTNDSGRTCFTYRVINSRGVRVQEGVTSWYYRGQVRLNPNATPTTNTPGWYVYNKDDITSVYAHSPASLNLLKTVCSGQ